MGTTDHGIQHWMTLSVAPFELELASDSTLKNHPEWSSVLEPLLSRLPDRIPVIARSYLREVEKEKIPELLGLLPLNTDDSTETPNQVWEVEVSFVADACIRELNRQYRHKDEATDVLSFTLLADSSGIESMVSLPIISLGAVFISLEWAWTAIRQSHRQVSDEAQENNCEAKKNNYEEGNFSVLFVLEEYVIERLIHGWLHLMGVNHDTMEDYNRVVALQRRVLDDAYRSQ